MPSMFDQLKISFLGSDQGKTELSLSIILNPGICLLKLRERV